jgi:hypothetical protein
LAGFEAIAGTGKRVLAFKAQSAFDERDHRRFVIHDEDTLHAVVLSEEPFVYKHAVLHEEISKIAAQDAIVPTWCGKHRELPGVDPLQDGSAGDLAVAGDITCGEEPMPFHPLFSVRVVALSLFALLALCAF